MSAQITVVGNLIGAATVDAVPKVSGRLDDIFVRLGDRVAKGQRLAKIEDSELIEQIKQAEASFEVSAATIRQREADLRLAQTNLDRTKNLFERQLIPKQTYDDTDARYQAAVAQLDLAKAQFTQSQARLDELKHQPGEHGHSVAGERVHRQAHARSGRLGHARTRRSCRSSTSPIVRTGRERRREGPAAHPSGPARRRSRSTRFRTRSSRAASRTSRRCSIRRRGRRRSKSMIENPQFRLKPGMYAKVNFTVEHRENTLVVPTNALVDVGGKRGVFLPDKGGRATSPRSSRSKSG